MIHLAKITTQVHQVFDVFYVTDEGGAKITDPEQLQRVRAAIAERLASLSAPDSARA